MTLKEQLQELQQSKIELLKEVKTTPTYNSTRLTSLLESVDKVRDSELKSIWDNSGYDDNYAISEEHIISLMKQSFLLGKSEQQEIHYNGLDS